MSGPVKWTRRRASSIKIIGMEDRVFRVRGGVRVHGRGWRRWAAMNATWPLASLRADRNSILISSPFGVWRISRLHVVQIEPYDALLGRGLKFESDDDDRVLIFWTFSRARVLAGLRTLGWDVTT